MNSNRVSKSITWKIGPGCLMNCARLFAAISCAILLDGSANAEDRPFKGRTQGQLAISPTEVPWIVTSVDSGTAIGTHVGPCTMVGYDVVDLSTFWVVGGFTWTTTNGDQLTGVYSGPMAFGESPGAISWQLRATIVSGSGRLRYATGEFVFYGRGTIGVSEGSTRITFTETFDGIIDY